MTRIDNKIIEYIALRKFIPGYIEIDTCWNHDIDSAVLVSNGHQQM